MTNPSLHDLRKLLEAAPSGEWALGESDDGHTTIDIPSDKWTEMATFYIHPHNAALAVALRNAAPHLLAIVEKAQAIIDHGDLDIQEPQTARDPRKAQLIEAVAAFERGGVGT